MKMPSLFMKISRYSPLLALSIGCFSFHFFYVYPFRRGFFCDDQSLKYPHFKNETIPKFLCFSIWGLLVSSVLLLSKLFLKLPLEQPLRHFLTGFIICLFLTDLSKHWIGRLRPYFLTMCNPDYPTICYDETAFYTIDDSKEQHFDEFFQKYVTDDDSIICKNVTVDEIREARLSFISGHASTSFYCAAFLMIFISNIKTQVRHIKHVLFICYLLIFSLASFISISRISDFKHHSLDVFIGAIVGSLISCFFNIISFPQESLISLKRGNSEQTEETKEVR